MGNLPEELVAKIFSYLENPITVSQVCSYFKLVATAQSRKMQLRISNETSDQIRAAEQALIDFKALRELKIEIQFDTNNECKAKLVNRFSQQITHLALKELTFLNPFFAQRDVIFSNLTSFSIENSDLSSSDQLPHFILRCCPKLTNLTLSGCSGLEIDHLEEIGRNLNQTPIEHFYLHPTYSYFDSTQNSSPHEHWTIEKLKTLSIRSKLVVIRPNFVKNIVGRRNENLTTLELIAELDLGENLAPKIIQNYPNLRKLSLGKGCSILRNEDFIVLCNFYKKLRSLEFHFALSDEILELRALEANESIKDLTIGLTKNVTDENIIKIARCLPNVTRLSVVLYYLSTSNQVFLTLIMQLFPNLQHIEFQRVGMTENMKFTRTRRSVQDEIDSPHLRHFDEIKLLPN